jgi:hypothetical protein
MRKLFLENKADILDGNEVLLFANAAGGIAFADFMAQPTPSWGYSAGKQGSRFLNRKKGS